MLEEDLKRTDPKNQTKERPKTTEKAKAVPKPKAVAPPKIEPKPLEIKEKKTLDRSKSVVKTASKPLTKKKESKTESQMREDFIKLIRSRKAKGIEPVLTISNDFQIGLSIGQGAFATVFRSVHKSTGYTVALKTYEKNKLTHRS